MLTGGLAQARSQVCPPAGLVVHAEVLCIDGFHAGDRTEATVEIRTAIGPGSRKSLACGKNADASGTGCELGVCHATSRGGGELWRDTYLTTTDLAADVT